MPTPTSRIPDLLDRVQRSGLVAPADLTAFLADQPPGALETLPPNALLDRLVAAHLLTPFQADRLAAGKYKGFHLGGYIILDKIGTGGMGQVFLAEHAAMRRRVAVKVLPAPIAEDRIARARFHREARSAAALNHPNIIRVFDMNREGRLLYLVMEYVEGITLLGLVAKADPLNYTAAADYARQVALGLQHAHENGMVHRDIKPNNLLIDRAGVVRILDLGLVRSLADEDSKLTSQIGASSILGTADYLAPEQAVDSSSVDIRADVYSLGATLYFLLAGRTMFPEGKTAQKLMWQQWKDPTPITTLRPNVPLGLEAVLRKALAKKREDRYQTPQEFADALAPYAKAAAPASGLIPIQLPRRPGAPLGITPSPSGTLPGLGSSHVVQLPESWVQRDPVAPDQTPMPLPPAPIPLPAPRPAASVEVEEDRAASEQPSSGFSLVGRLTAVGVLLLAVGIAVLIAIRN